jgi:FAD synthetase
MENKTRVLATGVFDLLHPGHVKYLEEDKKTGGENAELVVVVARDNTVKKAKGKAPIMPEDQRKFLVESLKVVDSAILGFEEQDVSKILETGFKYLLSLKPDIIAVGHDQSNVEKTLQKVIKEKGLNIKIVKIKKFNEELHSSTKIKEKIIEQR